MPARKDGDLHLKKSPLKLEGKHLCVVSPLSFTEACFSVAAVRALGNHCPEATIAVLCPSSQSTLWKTGIAELDHVLSYEEADSVKQIASQLQAFDVQFDSAIIWQAGKAAKAISQAGVAQRLGYPASGLEKYLTDVVSVASQPGPVEHRVRYYLELMSQLGADAFVRSSFEMPALPEPPEKVKIALAPFSEYGSAYQWPVERFLQVIDILNERHAGISWTIFDSQGARAKMEGDDFFGDLFNRDDLDLSDCDDREEFLNQLAQSSVLLACDGEIAHMAAHIGLPAAVIFGPNGPEWKRPLGKQSVVIREHVACSPCYHAKCPLDLRCQNEVTVEMVVEGLEQAILMR